jgi:hypothetical protein
MTQSRTERRHGWTPEDRERLSDYEREWTRPPRPDEIRERHHDELSRTVESDPPPAAKPKRETKPGVTKRRPERIRLFPNLPYPVIPANYRQTMDERPRSLLWHHKAPTTKPTPAEPLFRLTRASDRKSISCELEFNGESYGWEVRFLDGGELLYSRGAFASRELAVAWAWQKRRDIEG